MFKNVVLSLKEGFKELQKLNVPKEIMEELEKHLRSYGKINLIIEVKDGIYKDLDFKVKNRELKNLKVHLITKLQNSILAPEEDEYIEVKELIRTADPFNGDEIVEVDFVEGHIPDIDHDPTSEIPRGCDVILTREYYLFEKINGCYDGRNLNFGDIKYLLYKEIDLSEYKDYNRYIVKEKNKIFETTIKFSKKTMDNDGYILLEKLEVPIVEITIYQKEEKEKQN